MRQSFLIPYLQAFLAVGLWGASFVATKVALRYLTPGAVVWLRFAIGLVVLGLVVIARKQVRLPRLADLPYIALLGLIGITFHQWLQSNGLVTAQATTSAWIVATTPVFIAVLGWLVLQEKLTGFQIIGIAAAMAGVLLVVSRGDLSGLIMGQGISRGDVLMMISAPNWAVFSILSRRGLREQPAALMVFYVMVFGWALTSLLSMPHSQVAAAGSMALEGWLSVLFLGVFCSGLAYIFWYDAMKAVSAAQVGAFLYVEPLVTVLVAWAVIGERLTLSSLLGGAVILVGLWMVNRAAAPRRAGIRGKVAVRDIEDMP